MKAVHVAFCSDPIYAQPLAVALRSVVETARDPRQLHFWIVVDERKTADFQVACEIAAGAGAECTLLPITAFQPYLEQAPTAGHITTAAYYRLFLPELLPSAVERVIYLDSDVIVRHAVEDLWSTDLHGYTIAAVLKPHASEYVHVGLRSATDYFNSGVLVIDTRRWRAQQVREAALQSALRNPACLDGHDQPALNRVFAGQWQRLDLRWNQQFKFFLHTAAYLELERATLKQLRRHPFIIHYTTASKPWQALNEHPLRRHYYAVLDRTPFAGWRPPPAPWPARLRRWLTLSVPLWLRPGVLRNVYRPYYHGSRERLHDLARHATPSLHSRP